MLEPDDVRLVQVAQTPDIATLHEGDQADRPNGPAVPIKIGQHQEPFFRIVPAHNDILLLLVAIEDVVHPVEPAASALGLHIRTHILAVDFWCLAHHAHVLSGVLEYVLVGAWPDEVELEIGTVVQAGRGEVPAIDVIGADIGDAGEGGVEGANRLKIRGERGPLDDQDSGGSVDGSEDGYTTVVLVWSGRHAVVCQ